MVEELLGIASRPKTTDAIVAKLGRESTRLTQMQDIAGGRIVVPLPDLQDALLQILIEAHAELIGGAPRVTDTRDGGDEQGYRAVHVVIPLEGMPVEVQIRTPLQQLWAQIVERVDQALGSDLKHGAGPAEWLEYLQTLSDLFERVEAGELIGREVELPSPPDI